MNKPRCGWILLVLTLSLLVGLCPLPASASEAPTGTADLELGPPVLGPGDDEVLEITIGQARQALWYKGAYDILYPAWKEIGVEYDTLRAMYDVLLEEYKTVSSKLSDVTLDLQTWRTVAIVAGISGIVALGLLVLSLVL